MVYAAVGQICSRNNVAANLRICRSLVRRAAARGAAIVCLPEASDYIAPAKEVVGLAEPLATSSFLKGLQEEARSCSVWISVGIHELPSSSSSSSQANGNDVNKDSQEQDDRCYNTQCLINPDGEISSVYRKLHLFDVDVKGMSVQESGTTIKGKERPSVTETPVGKVGMLTCYDLRFPEASLILRQLGADIITYPSAFAVKTGMAHWEPLLRARAIETQCFVLAAAQIGSHPPTSRNSYGSACIVDPWGTVLARCNDNVAAHEEEQDPDNDREKDPSAGSFCIAEIDLEHLSMVRKQMPLWEQRRFDVYNEL